MDLVAGATRIVIKVGASVLVGNRGILSNVALRRIVNQIAPLYGQGKEIVLVTSGAIACGMEVLNLSTRPRRLPKLQAAAAIGQSKLMHAYEEFFHRRRIRTAQVLLTREGLEERSKRYRNARNTLLELLAERVIPIVNENDTISTEEISFGDNDGLSAFVARIVRADLLILLTDVPGFFITHGTRRRLLRAVPRITPYLYQHCYGHNGHTTVGGMPSKLNAARLATRAGIPMILADGSHAKSLKRLFAGECEGTAFLSPRQRALLRERVAGKEGAIRWDDRP
ncbi:MAG: glutamate 5-kinase [Deltaproteobacteria bacterium]|nr:glutamate 5-kinase [Deltaproteobacteria bacterium]